MADINLNDIQKHSEVIASCGTHVGTVDHLEGSDKIKLTKQDSGDGMHHYIPTSWVEEIRGNQIILNKNSEEVTNQWEAV